MLDFSPQPNNKVQSVTAATVTEENNQIQIAIKDQGACIHDYALDKIFDKFYSQPRPKHAPNAGQKSTGLGLNFVQEVAKLRGGSVTLSNSAGGGAVVVMTLPKT